MLTLCTVVHRIVILNPFFLSLFILKAVGQTCKALKSAFVFFLFDGKAEHNNVVTLLPLFVVRSSLVTDPLVSIGLDQYNTPRVPFLNRA